MILFFLTGSICGFVLVLWGICNLNVMNVFKTLDAVIDSRQMVMNWKDSNTSSIVCSLNFVTHY